MTGGRLFVGVYLSTFWAFRVGAYSRWSLIRRWAVNRINTVTPVCTPLVILSFFFLHSSRRA